MSDGTLDDRYLEWLYEKVGAVRNANPRRSYWKLLRQLYSFPFDWSVPNDDNRSEDGMDLRFEFLDDSGQYEVSPTWMGLQCSVLEMLIGLSRRVCFESFGTPGDWFWHLLQNIELKNYNDAVYSAAIEREVETCVTQLVDRQYDANGVGGLFPLMHPAFDQREVELCDQMSAYLIEGNYLDGRMAL